MAGGRGILREGGSGNDRDLLQTPYHAGHGLYSAIPRRRDNYDESNRTGSLGDSNSRICHPAGESVAAIRVEFVGHTSRGAAE